MNELKWNRLSDGLSIIAEKIEYAGCEGFAVYFSVSSEKTLHGNPCATFSPIWKDTGSFFAIENHTSSWCRPFWGESLSFLPEKTQLLVIKDNEEYTAFLPVCDSICKTLIRGCGENGGFEFSVLSNIDYMNRIPKQLSFIVLQGNNPNKLLRAVSKKAAELLGSSLKMREERKMPELFEYLGWCSWDALQIRVNEKDLIRKANEFSEKKIPVNYAIIDDMWADVPSLNEIPDDTSFSEMVDIMHDSKLRSFNGDKKRFPDGLKSAVNKIKLAGFKNVGFWFPVAGYWSGLEPGSEADRFLCGNTVTLSDGRIVISPEKENAEKAFDLLCERVKSWGADFVKIDNQGFHKNYHNISSFGESAKSIHSAIDKAADKYFEGAVINCMGMPNECMFNRLGSAISRCSDDFLPDNREWFFKHILQCSFNGLLQGQYFINDWDMWWTDDAQAIKNAVCRAVSGGPVYVSDKIGRSNRKILEPLCLSDGKILRCDNSAVPTDDCLFENPTKSEKIFKIFNRAGKNGIAAVFNINAGNKPVNGYVSPSDAGLDECEYAFYEFFSKDSGILKKGEQIKLTLENNDDFRLYTFSPMKNNIAVMGLIDKYIGVKAVSSENDFSVRMSEKGNIGFISEKEYAFVDERSGNHLEVKRNGLLSVVNGKDIHFTEKQIL